MSGVLAHTASATPPSLAIPRVDSVCVDGMDDQDSENKKRSKLLSDALRAVRDVRKAKPQALADALGLSVRGYQHFEAGGGRLNIDHVMAFARAIDCDPFGVLAAVQIGKPEFAAWVAQNKAMIAFMITLQEFAEETGGAMAHLETTAWVSAYREMFKGLSEQARGTQTRNETWLVEHAARLGLALARSNAEGQDGTGDRDGTPEADPESPNKTTS